MRSATAEAAAEEHDRASPATAPGGFGPPASASLDVGVIGNCAYSALVDARGREVWCCMPRFDGDPICNALLEPGDDASAWAIEIEDFASSKQWYEPIRAVLRT